MQPPNAVEFGYEQTLITGQYHQQLRDYAKEFAEQSKVHNAILKKEAAAEKKARRYASSSAYRVTISVKRCLRSCAHFIGEDWILLCLIGALVGFISFTMDYAAEQAYLGRLYAFDAAEKSMLLQYVVWVSYPVGFVVFAAGVVHNVNPQTAGTGFPELKAILGGIELRGFLSWRSMIAKYVGGTAAMCSGMPLVKGGILACIASCITHLLCKRLEIFKGIYENESRKLEMLAAAVAVAIACSFSSPVSGVLFCIELTATFFEVENYWRAFICTVCGTTVFRILSALSQYELTIVASMKNNLHLLSFPFDLVEFGAFSVLGVLCGAAGAGLVFLHRRLILFVRHRKKLSQFLQNYRFIYPTFVALLVATLTFPPLLGQYCAGRVSDSCVARSFVRRSQRRLKQLNSRLALAQLLYDKPLTSPPSDTITEFEATIRASWVNPQTGVLATLALYFIVQLLCSSISFTLAVPFGTLTPLFALGAALGRIVGEVMSLAFPDGINTGYGINHIVPGGYAIIGAAATAGATLHVISMALLVHEFTGQINYLLPTLWATVISNAVARHIMPSMIDSIIQIKKIPFLPVFKNPSSRTHQVLTQDIMRTNLRFLSHDSTYDDIKEMVICQPFVRSFPVVDSSETMLLIGSVRRNELIDELERHLTVHPHTSAVVCISEASGPSGVGGDSTNQPEAAEKHEQQQGQHICGANSPAEQHKALKAKNETTRKALAEQTESGKQSCTVESFRKRKSPDEVPKPILKRNNTMMSFSDQASLSGRVSELPLQLLEECQQNNSQQLSRSASCTDSTTLNHRLPSADDLAVRLGDVDLVQQNKQSNKSSPICSKRTTYVDDISIYGADEERLRWEDDRLQDKINMKRLKMDPAPFQLSEKTSLHKVHSLFVLLRLSQAYVTSFGRLVGIVTIKEVQTELEHPSVHEAPRWRFFRKTASATIGGRDRGMHILMSGDN